MDFMLEEELFDLIAFCLQNTESPEIDGKKKSYQADWKRTF